ncbi:MAG: hypothetical protein P1U46_01780 [Patescibacteria group bacterium]|nr:hypothetical protein [Patescibacteria group bacterium]
MLSITVISSYITSHQVLRVIFSKKVFVSEVDLRFIEKLPESGQK